MGKLAELDRPEPPSIARVCRRSIGPLMRRIQSALPDIDLLSRLKVRQSQVSGFPETIFSRLIAP
jgi:hypothetical protein